MLAPLQAGRSFSVLGPGKAGGNRVLPWDPRIRGPNTEMRPPLSLAPKGQPTRWRSTPFVSPGYAVGVTSPHPPRKERAQADAPPIPSRRSPLLKGT